MTLFSNENKHLDDTNTFDPNIFSLCGNVPAEQPWSHIPDDVGVLQLLKQRHLPDSSAGNSLLLALQADLLHGHHLSRGLVPAFVHNAVCPCRHQSRVTVQCNRTFT